MSDISIKKVFISRIDEEKKIGGVLKENIEDAFAGRVKVFSSDDPRELPGGERWLSVIERELKGAVMLIAVLSPVSVSRPWVLMEFGGAWIRDISVLPVCHSGLRNDSLPRPLGDFQGCAIEQKNVGDLILTAVAAATKGQYPRRFDTAAMRADLLSAASGVVRKSGVDQKTQQDAPIPLDVSDGEIALLEILAEVKDSGGDEYEYTRNIASAVGGKASIVEMLLDGLVEKGLAKNMHESGAGPSYAISHEGVRLLVNLGRLGDD